MSVFKVSLESAHNLYDDLKSKLIKIILYMVPLTSFGYLRVLGSFALTLWVRTVWSSILGAWAERASSMVVTLACSPLMSCINKEVFLFYYGWPWPTRNGTWDWWSQCTIATQRKLGSWVGQDSWKLVTDVSGNHSCCRKQYAYNGEERCGEVWKVLMKIL